MNEVKYGFHANAKNLTQVKNVSKLDKSIIDTNEKAGNSCEIDDKEKEDITQSQLEKATERDMISKAEIGDTYKNGVQNIKPNVKEHIKMEENKKDVQCCANETVCFGENLIGKTKSNWKQVFSYFCFLK